jgi:hypothetical protein
MALVWTGRRVPVERWVTAPPVNKELSEGVRHHSDVRKRHGLRTIHQADSRPQGEGKPQIVWHMCRLLCSDTVQGHCVQQHCMRV